MRADRLAAILAAAAVGAAVILGFWATGGHMQGRAERRDEARYRDLLSLKNQVECLADALDRVLPDSVAETEDCHHAERYEDPYTGKPYVYQKVSITAYRLCAEFESPDVTRFFHGSLDPQTGCLSLDLKYR